MRSRRVRVAFSVIVAALATSSVLVAPARGVTPADGVTARAAADWIITQQRSDGGFEVAGSQGFETPDAILAIAEAAQTGTTWSTAKALAAVEALEYGGSGGPTPLDAIDDWITSGVNPGEAAKIVLLVAAPLGLDPEDFGSNNVDLAAIMYPSGCASAPDTSGTFFYESMFLALGGEVVCGAPDPAIVADVRSKQRPSGGWNFNGSLVPVDPPDPFDTNNPDVDSTAVAIEVLVASGAAWNDPAVLAGLAFLAAQRTASGAFEAFGTDDPNATAVAMLAIAAAGFDPTVSCWRDAAVPADAGGPYAAPNAWLRSQQQPDGHIASPYDGPDPNTFASSQSVQGLLLGWLPIGRATGAPTCVPDVPGPAPVDLVPRFTG